MKIVYFGAGCFWGTEEYFRRVEGVVETEVGYANGINTKLKPTYERVCSGKRKFCEVARIVFDESIISLDVLLHKYFKIINPYIINKQGNDKGVQYRTLIASDSKIVLSKVKDFVKEIQKNDKKKIVVEVKNLENYFRAEEYHQKYLIKNPNGYCHINLN